MATPTITEILHQEEENLARFRRALRKEHQTIFDDLWIGAYKHRSAAKYAGHLLTFETFLLCMLVEEHEEVMKLRELPREVVRLRGEAEFVRRKLKELEKLLQKLLSE